MDVFRQLYNDKVVRKGKRVFCSIILMWGAQKSKTVGNEFGKTLALKRLLGIERHCSEMLFDGLRTLYKPIRRTYNRNVWRG